MKAEIVTHSPEETRALGRRVGAGLKKGDVLLLVGDLGSGKTTFAKGVAEACGVDVTVRSPTFALMHKYRGDPDVLHVDLYRERDALGLEDLDWEAEGREAVTLVEWPRGLTNDLWPDAPRVHLEHVDETSRRIHLPEDAV
ncbi:MAG: tRNA (adenosine(37)-N6)-threonylcarbamoyltransferase complex ATPase subunit type 1 TsaE [Planctomycetota bacterium]|nr:tRNA (adenosine(37)-N6)-threonylcarbamoyltransferase complex ATPase subunit type 1 TsaE [Planctomycetota bacterium]